MAPPALPVEILSRIVQLLAPDNPREILRGGSETTQTLLALTRTCTATYGPAAKLLREHCVYLDAAWKVEAFARSLVEASPPAFMLPHLLPSERQGLLATEAIFVAPFMPECDPQAEEEVENFPKGIDLLGDFCYMPRWPVPWWKFTTQRDWHKFVHFLTPEQHHAAAHALRRIFTQLGPSLKRLIINLSIAAGSPKEEDRLVHDLNVPLLEGLRSLVNLEEYVSLRDERVHFQENFFRVKRFALVPEIAYGNWQKLRYLCLCDTNLGNAGSWLQLVNLPSLEMVVFPAIGHQEGVYNYSILALPFIKENWIDSLAKFHGTTFEEANENPRPLTVVNLDAFCDVPVWERFRRQNRTIPTAAPELDPKNRIRLLEAYDPAPVEEKLRPPIGNEAERDYECDWRVASPKWAEKHALAGRLWDMADESFDHVLFNPSKGSEI